ncbi:hypothetical protein SAMN05443144_106196 [Fodinibius roseus]|uniref:Type VI secretion system contractile sheath protein TssC n=1 Tax=Fodinibius roseus TaxID=1194090 RepID=A0A1M5A159_9BACT|nr:DUF5458 family protein [Fodinibius roseus]SHF23971.1 hypothetical protein SAMN05443144_106196 [Fodinibius roseus]
MQSQEKRIDEQQAIAQPEQQLSASTKQFITAGGFDLLEGVIDEVQNLNPERRARKEIFLNEASKKADRQDLLKRLKVWEGALSGEGDAVDIVAGCEETLDETDRVLKANLKEALHQTRDLERSYRSAALFFKNSEEDKVKNVSLMNADMAQLKDLDFSRFIDAVSEQLKSNYDRLDLRDNYSLLVIPGYLGSNKVLEKWANIAHENKVMLVTDFGNFDTPDDVMEMFEAANLTGGEKYRSNVIMTCNWIRGRDKAGEVGEDEALYVPAAGAYAGKIYGTRMSQVAAGKKFGSITEADSVRFPLKKSEIANVEKLGLVPMVSEYGKVMAFSAKTLFNGDNLGLQTYSVVRVFDYITKVLMDFLNRRAFENFNSRTKKNLLRQIVRFLDGVTGPDKLIENFDIRRFEQDPNKKDHINLDIHLRPFFPAKNFLIKMDGQKGEDGNEWEAEYEQD